MENIILETRSLTKSFRGQQEPALDKGMSEKHRRTDRDAACLRESDGKGEPSRPYHCYAMSGWRSSKRLQRKKNLIWMWRA